MKSKILLVSFIIIILWIFGFVVGRLTVPKPQPFDTTLTPEESIPQEGGGILVPESPISQIIPSYGLPISPSPGHLVSLSWSRFVDPYIAIRVRALRADSINYQFKKSWHQFKASQLPNFITSLSVYGVAPDSVRITGEIPPPQQKNFSLILTCTTLPSANLLFGYKNFLLHTQHIPVSLSPGHPVTHSFCFGIGYHLKF